MKIQHTLIGAIFALAKISSAADAVYQPSMTPQALISGSPNPVRVAVRIAGGNATNVRINEVESGQLVPLGLLSDDGRGYDRKAGDRIYSGQVLLGLRVPGLQTLRITASINGRSIASIDTVIETFGPNTPTAALRGEPAATLEDRSTGEIVACDEITLFAVPGTPVERISGALRAIGATLAGLDAYGGMNSWSIRMTCASNVETLRQAVGSLAGEGWNAELSIMGESTAVAIADPLMLSPQSYGDSTQQLTAPRVNTAWVTTLGAAVVAPLVAVVDTGADFGHEDMVGRLVEGQNFGAGANNDLKDEEGHGTGIASLIAANAFNNIGMAGVAPEAQVLVVRINRKGGVSMTRAASGIRYAADHDASIINCSFGTPFYHHGLAQAIHHANQLGRLVVAAAGNRNGDVWYPAKFGNTTNPLFGPMLNTQTMSVGGYDRRGLHWRISTNSGSAYGAEIDLDAPAELMLVANPITVPINGQTGNYAVATGTSGSTAIVSGVAALVLSVRPETSREELFQLLIDTALPTGGTHPDGRLIKSVDAWNAVFQAVTQGSCVGCPGTPEVSVNGAGVKLATEKARSATQIPSIHAAYLTLRPAASYQIRFHHNFKTFDTYASPLFLNSGFFDSFSISVNPQPYHLRPLTDPLTLSGLNAAILWGGSGPNLLMTPQVNSGIGTIRTVLGQAGSATQILSIVLDTFSLPGRSSVLPSWGSVTIDDITPNP